MLSGVQLESSMAFVDVAQVETRTSWDDCVGLRLVVNRIFLGPNSFTTPRSARSMLAKLESFELA